MENKTRILTTELGLEMGILTREQFAMELPNMGLSGQFVHIHAMKTADLKKGNEGNQVIIVRNNTVQLGTDYGNIVENRAKAEGVEDSVELQGLPDYLERVNPFITRHKTKGTLYMDAHPISAQVSYLLNNEPVELDEVRSMLYAKDLPRKSSKPKTQGDLEKTVQWRRYSLENVMDVTVNGKRIDLL
jgi:hypothetical protein